MALTEYEVAKYIYDYFVQRGFTPESTCGILGNVQQECSLNPNNPPIPDFDALCYATWGVGILQWTTQQSHNTISSWCSERGYQFIDINNPLESLKVQCEYLYYQMTNPVGQWIFNGSSLADWENAGNIGQYDMSKEEFIASRRNPGFLAVVFCSNFERPNAYYAHVQHRVDYAAYWYSYFLSHSQKQTHL